MNPYGINRPCYPSVGEIMQAKKVFTEYIQQHAHEAQVTPGSVNYTNSDVIPCPGVGVWTALPAENNSIASEPLHFSGSVAGLLGAFYWTIAGVYLPRGGREVSKCQLLSIATLAK